MAELFDDVKARGIPFANHETDLYIPVTEETTALLKAHGYGSKYATPTTVTNQVEGGRWYDVPFAYLPAWEAKRRA